MEVLKNVKSPTVQMFVAPKKMKGKNFTGVLFPATGALSNIDQNFFSANGALSNLDQNFFGATGGVLAYAKPNFLNLSGQLLTDYNNCKAAYATYQSNMTAYNNYLAAWNAWNADYNNSGCYSLTPPPSPTLQEKVSGTDPCAVAANQAADVANSNMQSAYNTAKAAYDAKVASCNSKLAAKPGLVSQPAPFSATNFITATTSGDTTYSGFTGMRNAVGVLDDVGLSLNEKPGFKNACAPCAMAALAADGEDQPAPMNPILKYGLIAVAGYLLYKFVIKKS